MRRHLLISAIFIVGCVMVLQTACAPAAKSTAAGSDKQTVTTLKVEEKKAGPNEPQPKIVFEKLVYDFGTIAPASKHSGEFKFTNTGKGLLRIGKINSSCGCTVPKLAKEEYVPGESGVIKVDYSANRTPGSTTKTLSVATNDKQNQNITLTVTAVITIKVECKPEKMNLSLKEANAACPKITLRSIDNKPFAINGFKSTGDTISINFDPAVAKTEFTLEPKVDIDKLQRNLNGQVEITLTHPECNSVSIPYSSLPRFNVNPPSIVVFDARPENPVRKQVTIISNYGENFEIESVTSQKGILKVLSQERGNARWVLDVEVTPPDFKENKPRMFTDVLAVTISGGQKLEITCRGFYPSAKKQ